MGAAYYALQTWGNGQRCFKFQCRMPITGNPSAQRYFEATDTDSLRAMVTVLEEVERWRASDQ
jgi:ACT domain-containing protein